MNGSMPCSRVCNYVSAREGRVFDEESFVTMSGETREDECIDLVDDGGNEALLTAAVAP